jgi:hypothetical protein
MGWRALDKKSLGGKNEQKIAARQEKGQSVLGLVKRGR